MIATLVSSLSMLIACAAASDSTRNLRPPQRPRDTVVVDGQISKKEWEGAQEVAVAPEVTVLHFQTQADVLLAVRITTPSPSYVDMFVLLDDGKRINLHASMQVGERELPAEGWTDREPPTHWGKQEHWRANAVKEAPGKDPSAPINEMFVPYEGFEFRLSKKRFGSRSFRLRLEVRDFAAHRADIVFPEGSGRFDAASWAPVSLEP